MKNKKILISLIIAMMMVMIAGCGNSKNNDTEGGSEVTSEPDTMEITVDRTPTGELLPMSEVKKVTVHDPSIVLDEKTGMYYIFGSHMAWAKSEDMISWAIFSNNINTDYATLFAAEAEWAQKAGGTYAVSGNLWAPDVIYNEEMGKW